MKVILEHAGEYVPPMDVRDYFATKAMTVLIFDKKHNWGSGGNLGKGWIEGLEKMSECAYEIADAMVKARKIKNDS